jgi:hypothetical protein
LDRRLHERQRREAGELKLCARFLRWESIERCI